MGQQFTVNGPYGVDVTESAGTTPKFALGTKLETKETGAIYEKPRIYRYVKSHAALVVGEPRLINSNFELISTFNTTSAGALTARRPIGVAQVATASATGALYGWVQTGGWFDNFAVKDASANKQLFTSATVGYVGDGNTTAQKKIHGLAGGDGATLGAGTTSMTADAYSPDEIFVDPWQA